jgi:hypothetical protein
MNLGFRRGMLEDDQGICEMVEDGIMRLYTSTLEIEGGADFVPVLEKSEEKVAGDRKAAPSLSTARTNERSSGLDFESEELLLDSRIEGWEGISSRRQGVSRTRLPRTWELFEDIIAA